MRSLIAGEMVVVCGSQVDGPVKGTGSRLGAPQKCSFNLSLLWKVWRPPLSSGRVGSWNEGQAFFQYLQLCRCEGENGTEVVDI